MASEMTLFKHLIISEESISSSVQGTSSSPSGKSEERRLAAVIVLWYFHFAEELHYMLLIFSLACDQLPYFYAQLFFSLSLQHKDLAHLLPLFGILLWKESILVTFMHEALFFKYIHCHCLWSHKNNRR